MSIDDAVYAVHLPVKRSTGYYRHVQAVILTLKRLLTEFHMKLFGSLSKHIAFPEYIKWIKMICEDVKDRASM